jgi:hypothetical protein
MRKMVGKEESIEEGNKRMLMNQAVEVKHHAEELMKAISKNDKVDAWVVAKLERATTDLSDITHYLEGASQGYEKGGMMNTYDEGGEMEESEEVDLFEDYENIPDNVQEILDKYEEDFEEGNYKRLQEAQKELEKIGYTFEFGLDGVAYNLRKMRYGGYMADGGMMAKGGEVNKKRMYNFLKDDLVALEKAIEENNQEEIYKFFSYWNIHLSSLEPKTSSKRMYEFLKDDLVGLEAATKELPSSKDETDRFFSYWNRHLNSLEPNMADGGMMARGGYIKVVEDRGYGKVINELYNQWNEVKNEEEYSRWKEKLRNTKFGTYGDIPISQVLKNFDFDNAPINSFHLKTFKKEVELALNKMADGGKVKFSDKVKSISMRLEGTKVPKRLEDDYGKRYSKLEAKMAAQRIAGSMKKKGY